MLRIVLAAVVTASGLFPTLAQEAAPTFVVIGGQCAKLVVAGVDFTGTCNPKVASNNAGPDKVMFHFALADGTAVSIVGIDLPNPSSDSDEIEIVRVHVGKKLGPLGKGPHAASGKCVFGNPYAGPMTIRCDGAVGKKTLVADFLTDGLAPKEY